MSSLFFSTETARVIIFYFLSPPEHIEGNTLLLSQGTAFHYEGERLLFSEALVSDEECILGNEMCAFNALQVRAFSGRRMESETEGKSLFLVFPVGGLFLVAISLNYDWDPPILFLQSDFYPGDHCQQDTDPLDETSSISRRTGQVVCMEPGLDGTR